MWLSRVRFEIVEKNMDAGRQVRQYLNHLILDCLKKGRETETKGDLAKTRRKRRAAMTDLHKEEENNISWSIAATVVQISITDTDVLACRIVPVVMNLTLSYK